MDLVLSLPRKMVQHPFRSAVLLLGLILGLMLLINANSFEAFAQDYNQMYGRYASIWNQFNDNAYYCKQAGISHITTSLARCVDGILDHYTEILLRGIVGKFSIFITVCATLALIFLFVRMMLGAVNAPVAESFILFFKIMLVIIVGLNVDNLMDLSRFMRHLSLDIGHELLNTVRDMGGIDRRVTELATNPELALTDGRQVDLRGYEVFVGMDQMIAMITGYCDQNFGAVTLGPCGGGSGDTRVALQVIGLGLLIVIIIASGGTGIFLVLTVILLLISLIMMVIEVMMVYLTSMITLSIMLVAAPIILPLLLLPQTEGIVKKWFETTLVYTLIPVMLLGFVALMYSMLGQIPGKLLDYYKEITWHYLNSWERDAKRVYQSGVFDKIKVPMNATIIPPCVVVAERDDKCSNNTISDSGRTPSTSNFSSIDTWRNSDIGVNGDSNGTYKGVYAIPVENAGGVNVNFTPTGLTISASNPTGAQIFADAAGGISVAWSPSAEAKACATDATGDICLAAQALGRESAQKYGGKPFVEITHANGTVSVFSGLNDPLQVKLGTSVQQGQQLGMVLPGSDVKYFVSSSKDANGRPTSSALRPSEILSKVPDAKATTKAQCEANKLKVSKSKCAWYNPVCQTTSLARTAWNAGFELGRGAVHSADNLAGYAVDMATGDLIGSFKNMFHFWGDLAVGFIKAINVIFDKLPNSALAFVLTECITVPFLGGLAIIKTITMFVLPALGVAMLLQAMFSVAKQMPDLAQRMVGTGVYTVMPMGGVQLSRQMQVLAAAPVNIAQGAASGAASGAITGGPKGAIGGAVKGGIKSAVKSAGDAAKIGRTTIRGTKN